MQKLLTCTRYESAHTHTQQNKIPEIIPPHTHTHTTTHTPPPRHHTTKMIPRPEVGSTVHMHHDNQNPHQATPTGLEILAATKRQHVLLALYGSVSGHVTRRTFWAARPKVWLTVCCLTKQPTARCLFEPVVISSQRPGSWGIPAPKHHRRAVA